MASIRVTFMPTMAVIFTLADALKKKGLSKRQFAKKLGVPYQYVFRYFREGYDPKLSKLHDFAKAINVKITDLYRETPNTQARRNSSSQ